MSAAPIARDRLPDHASHHDARGIPIDRVGIRGLSWPITVWDRDHRYQHTVATIDATVSLDAEVKGTHMSRFVEILAGARSELSLKSLPGVLAEIQRRLGAQTAHLDVRFPYFLARKAPVSGVESLMEYRAAFHAERTGEDFQFELEVDVPVTTLCPCSKAVSDRGAHNQRGRVVVRARADDMLWIEDVVEAVESCASSPVYALLKREDEKYVTERAYDHPRFVEDLVRDVILALQPRVRWAQVSVENLESIHNHSAWAELTWESGSVPAPVPTSPPAPAELPGFGAWLRAERTARTWSQQDLALRIGVSGPHLSKVESGERQLAPRFLDRLAEVFGQNADAVRLRAGIVPPALLAAMQAAPERYLS